MTDHVELRWNILQAVLENYQNGDPVELAERCYTFVAGTETAATKVKTTAKRPPTGPKLADTEKNAVEAAIVPTTVWSELSKAPRETMEAISAVCEAGDGWCRTGVLRARMGLKPGTLSVRLVGLSKLGLIERQGQKYRPAGKGGDPPAPSPKSNTTMRRFSDHAPLDPESVNGLAKDHKAVTEGHTLFPSTVVAPADAPRLLVSGQNSRKTGAMVTKGPWKDFPIYTLTLEERKTCPKSCFHWTTCYGNGMPLARRQVADADLIPTLARELGELQREHAGGFVVRLHILGDFYSVEYVQAWRNWLNEFPALHVFGYTARLPITNIGYALQLLRDEMWNRFAIRFSEATSRPGGATTIWRKPEAATVPEGIVCPAQTDATDCCGTCGLCWHPEAKDKTIVFVAHGRIGRKMPREIEIPAQEKGNEGASNDLIATAHAAAAWMQSFGYPVLTKDAGHTWECKGLRNPITAAALVAWVNKKRQKKKLPPFEAARSGMAAE